MTRSLLAALALLFLSACTAGPMTTTESQRASATRMLAAAELAALIAVGENRLAPDDLPKVRAAIALLQQRVDESGTTPVDWSTILLDIATLYAEWQLPEPDDPAAS